LELGGKNAALFFDDLNEDEIVNGIMEAGYLNQGQICAAAENIWLPAFGHITLAKRCVLVKGLRLVWCGLTCTHSLTRRYLLAA